MLVDYLVTSKARKAVLRTLHSRGSRRDLSIREVALSAGVPYSNAYGEVMKLKEMGLLETQRDGKALRCRWYRGTSTARMVRMLFTEPREEKGHPDEGAVLWNLKRWGGPLARTGTPGTDLSLEETLGRALPLARRHPDVARAWPVVFGKNRSRVNLPDLESWAGELGQKRAFGFLLSLCGALLRDPSLRSYAKRLRDRRVRRTTSFFDLPRGRRARALACQRTPKAAKEWRFTLNMPMESFETTFRKFVRDR